MLNKCWAASYILKFILILKKHGAYVRKNIKYYCFKHREILFIFKYIRNVNGGFIYLKNNKVLQNLHTFTTNSAKDFNGFDGLSVDM